LYSGLEDNINIGLQTVLSFFVMTNKIVVLSTCGSEAEAEKLARAVVEARLAACVNVVPGIRSFYRWQGALESSDEVLLVIKSTTERFPALRETLQSLHSYEVPEIVALPIADGAEDYLNWLDGSVRRSDQS
jgi:periplasmic divalent cation tolerance protein